MDNKNRILALIIFSALPSAAWAMIDIQDMMENLKSILNPAMSMLLIISFVMGVLFVLKGLLLLKAFAAPLTQSTRPGEIAGPLVYIVVGAVLLYIPTSTDVLSNTLFGFGGPSIFRGATPSLESMGKASTQIMGYADNVAIEGQWATLIDTIVLYVEFIGFLAFLRGWLIIAHAGQPGVQPGSISRGIVHIVGGILAINFLPLSNAVYNTIMR